MKSSFLLLLVLVSALGAVELTAFKTEGNSWDDAFAEARKASRTITVPSGKYELAATLEVNEGMTLYFEDGAELFSSVSPMIRHRGGVLVVEGRGMPGVLRSSAEGARGWANPLRAAVIDLNDALADNPPSLVMRNMEFRCYNGIDAYWMKDGNRNLVKNDISSLEVYNCRFFCVEKGIGANGMNIGRAVIENCLFEGADNPIHLNVPMPGGISVVNNELRDFGRSGIQLGKGGQVSDGCTTHLPNAVIRGNRLLKGGRGSKVTDSYIHGILVYGNNVVVEGNIVRDVNRGVPVPGAPLGHQFIDEEGNPIRGHWVMRDGKRVRLAGAAIYLKANRSLVMGNICTNSGYRSVIEIKTGGKEPFVSVCNNIVDGRALDIDESFGFECNSGLSVWMNNVVYDMPHEAFVVRSGYENTFMNNLIVNAKIGFALSGNVPGQGEWINGNRFINVDVPVSYEGKNPVPAHIPESMLPGPVLLDETADLPDPSPDWVGRLVLRGKTLYFGVSDNCVSKWMEFNGTLIEPKEYEVVGPELAFNADQSGKEESSNPALNDPAFPGWSITMRTATERPLDPHDGFVSFDTETFQTGGRSMMVLFPEHGSEWRALQRIPVKLGRRYRATALVKGEEPRNFYLVLSCGKNFQRRGVDSQDWQLLSVDFTAKSSICDFIIRGSKTSPGIHSWVDSISLRELREVGEVDLSALQTTGDELISYPQLEDRPSPKRWSLAGAERLFSIVDDLLKLQITSEGNLSFSTTVPLEAGSYRYQIEYLSNCDKFLPSVKLPDGSRPSSNPIGPLSFQCDFTLSETGNVSVGVWGGSLTPDDFITLKRISLKALAPQP